MIVTIVAIANQESVVTWQLPITIGPEAIVQMLPNANSIGWAYTAPSPMGAVHSWCCLWTVLYKRLECNNLKWHIVGITAFLVRLFFEERGLRIVIPLASSSQNFNMPHNWKTVHYCLMKLATHLPRNNTHVYTKSHNSGYDIFSEIPLFSPLPGTRNVIALID